VQDIIALNLTRAVQLCVNIATHIIAESDQPVPTTMAGAFDRLHEMQVLSEALTRRLKGAVGFRNIAVHQYESIDWDIVYILAHEHLDDFRQFAASILSFPDDDERTHES